MSTEPTDAEAPDAATAAAAPPPQTESDYEKVHSDTDQSSQHNDPATTTTTAAAAAAAAGDVEDGRAKAEVPPKAKRTKGFIVLVAVCAALGGLIFGYDIAGAGATFVMEGFQLHFGWTCAVDDPTCVPATRQEKDRDQGMINGMFGLGATLGAIGAPWLADSFGRRPCLFASSVTFIFGAAMQAGAVNMTMMWIARIFSGLGIGGLSMCSPVYIAELAPEHARGQLSTLWQLAITFGILVASAANIGLAEWDDGWRISYGGNIVFALVLIAALVFMPESPRFLTGHGREDEAREAMKKVRFEDEIDREMEELRRECEEEKEIGVATWKEVVEARNKQRYRLLLGVGLQGIQQLSGINAIMFYAPTIFEDFFGSTKAIYGTFGLNVINFLSTFITIYAVEKFGRVLLLVTGGSVMLMALIACAVLASLPQTHTVGTIVIVFAAIYIVGFAYSWGPVVWTVCAEMFPVRSRGKSTGITTMTNWAMTTAVGALFPMAKTASLSGCFGFFAGMIFLGTLMVYIFQAETAMKTILEIDKAYANHKPKLKRF